MRFDGGCHCGSVRLSLSTTRAPQELGVRACQCSFCVKHGGLTTSDPEGKTTIVVREEAPFQPYAFGTKTTDFYLCGSCGVYVAAVLRRDGGTFSTVNVRSFDGAPFAGLSPQPVVYESERTEDRVARRVARWTPTEIFTWRVERADADPGAELVAAYLAELEVVLGGFDPSSSVSADPEEMGPPGGSFVVVYEGESALACGGLKAHAPGVGEIKRMYVAKQARRRGLGRVVLRALEQEARRLDLRRLVLDTAAPLTAASALYESEGYVEVEPFNDNRYAALWFAKELLR